MAVRPTRKQYNHKIADEAKKQRCVEAEQRQQSRSKRTSQQQIAKLDKGGYEAKKERARLI